MTDFTYKIANMERNADGVVTTIHWIHTGVDGEYTGSVYGSMVIEHNEEDTFIPFEELTEDVVVEWVKNSLGDETVEAQEKDIQGQIDNMKSPKVILGTPWSN